MTDSTHTDSTATSPPPVEWVSFTDSENTTWLFDTTFLTSGWSCTFGSTCPGTEPGDNGARGCCAHGAYLVDDDEVDQVVKAAKRLTAAQWFNFDKGAKRRHLIKTTEDGPMTRRVDDACIFLNPKGFAGGHGCALHIGALDSGERPLDWKPTVCWQVPFRREYYDDAVGTQTIAVRAWRRSDWGEGGDAFAWWCTEHITPAAGDAQMWRHHQDELRALVGEEPLAFLNGYLASRTETPVTLGTKRST